MKRMVWLVSLGFVLVCFAALPASAGMTGMALLTEIQNGYQKTNDLEAQFVQEYSGKMMRIPQKAEGKVYLKKKGMMRWDYRVPNQKLISNGSTLWFYQPEEKQVFVTDVEKVLKEKTPLAFLAGEGICAATSSCSISTRPSPRRKTITWSSWRPWSKTRCLPSLFSP
jgi:outer membrane lipoprotein carrier protein